MKQGYFALLCVASVLAFCFATPAVAQFEPFRPLPERPPIPEDNPMSPAKVELGKQLFFDPRLSASSSLSCNSCHNVMAGGEDGRAVSRGARGEVSRRSAPTLWNVGFYTVYYWDGRATSLEALVKDHLLSPVAMARSDADAVVEAVARIPGYRDEFAAVFGGERPVSYENIAKAIAAYLRVLVTTDSPFDRYLEGDKSALSDTAKRGFEQYVETGCAACHFWVSMAGPVPGLAFEMGEGFYELFPNHTGTRYEETYRLTEDLGRYEATGDPTERRMWRVPTLRNIAVTAPYFHNGSVATLDQAVRVMARTQLQKDLSDRAVKEIVAFLNALTGEFPEQSLPQLPATPNRSGFGGPEQKATQNR